MTRRRLIMRGLRRAVAGEPPQQRRQTRFAAQRAFPRRRALRTLRGLALLSPFLHRGNPHIAQVRDRLQKHKEASDVKTARIDDSAQAAATHQSQAFLRTRSIVRHWDGYPSGLRATSEETALATIKTIKPDGRNTHSEAKSRGRRQDYASGASALSQLGDCRPVHKPKLRLLCTENSDTVTLNAPRPRIQSSRGTLYRARLWKRRGAQSRGTPLRLATR